MANNDTAGLVPLSGGRKSAYVARNRLALLRATQRAIADHGHSVTIEQIADEAEVSVSTVYKHFTSKELLVTEAFVSAHKEWEEWAVAEAAKSPDPLEQIVLPMRLFVRSAQTHPMFTRMCGQYSSMVVDLIPALSQGLLERFGFDTESVFPPLDDMEIRVGNVTNCVAIAFIRRAKDPTFTAKQADRTISIALKMFNIPPEVAHAITEKPMPLLSLVGAP
jgi:AcrR family transcriptional regulator